MSEYVCGDFEYEIMENYRARITKYTGEGEALTLPVQLDGHRVSVIGRYAFAWNKSLYELIIPQGVKTIENHAFMHCARLEKVYIPDSVQEIFYEAFDKCSNLEEVRLPDSIKYIPDDMFNGCSALKKIDIPQSIEVIGRGAFRCCSNLKQVVLPESLRSIERDAFSYCYSLEELHIPSTVTEIDEEAFDDCHFLVISAEPGSEGWKYARRKGIPTETIVCGDFNFSKNEDGTLLLRRYLGSAQEVGIPAQVNGQRIVSIGTDAFRAQSQLRRVTISEGVERICEGAFADCDELESLIIPASVSVVESCALLRCEALTDIRICPESPYFFAEGGALYESQTDTLNAWPSARGSVCVREGTRCIGVQAFNSCNITDVFLPESVEIIGTYAFNWCEQLTRLKLPESMELISNFAFHHCIRLKEIIMPVSLGALRPDAFHACMALEEIHLPQKLPMIPRDAFGGCRSLSRLYIPDPETNISADAFGFFGPAKVTIFADPDSRAAAWCNSIERARENVRVLFVADKR